MNFHVASSLCVWGGGVSLNFASQQEGGSCFNCSNKIIKKNLTRFACSVFINSTLIRPIYFSVCKSYSVLVVLLLQLLSYIDID